MSRVAPDKTRWVEMNFRNECIKVSWGDECLLCSSLRGVGVGGMNQIFNRQDKHSRVSKHQLVRHSVYKSANYKILLRWLDHQCKSLTGLDVSPGTPWKCITRLKPAWFELHVLLKTSKTIFFVSMFIHIHLMCTPPPPPTQFVLPELMSILVNTPNMRVFFFLNITICRLNEFNV